MKDFFYLLKAPTWTVGAFSLSINAHKYCNLLTSGKLYSYLADVEDEAQTLFLRLVKKYAGKEGVTEQLKAENPMKWVRMMNNIRERVNEVVNAEMIFI